MLIVGQCWMSCPCAKCSKRQRKRGEPPPPDLRLKPQSQHGEKREKGAGNTLEDEYRDGGAGLHSSVQPGEYRLMLLAPQDKDEPW